MKSSLIIAISLFAVSLSTQAAAQSLENCISIEDTSERLACYDRLAGRLPADNEKADGAESGEIETAAPNAVVIVPATPAVTPTVTTVKPATDAESAFGLEHKQKPEEGRPDELQFKWARKKKDSYGKWIITLENGQVWRQTDSRSFRFGNSEQRVVISRGFIGGFFLSEPERKMQIRVKRVK